jgi:hypothetical protein
MLSHYCDAIDIPRVAGTALVAIGREYGLKLEKLL